MTKPARHSGHGGARAGAGRPRKYGFWAVIDIGQACETLWRVAVVAALQAEHDRLFHQESDIQALWNAAQSVPVAARRNWYAGEDGALHRADLETELHALNGTPDDPGPAPRGVCITARPPRGTRKRIISEVAARTGLPESAVDNLWQAYRRFEREA